MRKVTIALGCLFLLAVGIVIGGYLFSQSQPRSLLALNRCQDCLSRKELAGLLASVLVNKLPGLIPAVVFETDKTIVIQNPFAKGYVDYVIIPKKDIKNIGEYSEDYIPYLNDVYLVARHIIEEKNLPNYEFFTNGPGFQDVTYLHFHLTYEQNQPS
jgi:hypothetical protein